MTFKPASDWVDAWPEEPESPPPSLPPARPRTRKVPVDDQPAVVSAPDPETVAAEDAPPRVDEPSASFEEPTAPETNATDPAPYAVGYKKPPVHTRFGPGQSGNPKGRPKAAKGLKTIARETLTQKVLVRTPAGEKKITRIEAVLQKTVEQAMKGNARALAELMKLYSSAVPDEKRDAESNQSIEELNATDLATLAELRELLAIEQEQGR